jgi:hypothetical protein
VSAIARMSLPAALRRVAFARYLLTNCHIGQSTCPLRHQEAVSVYSVLMKVLCTNRSVSTETAMQTQSPSSPPARGWAHLVLLILQSCSSTMHFVWLPQTCIVRETKTGNMDLCQETLFKGACSRACCSWQGLQQRRFP